MIEDVIKRIQEAKSDAEITWIVTEGMLKTFKPELADAVIAVAVTHWFTPPILSALLDGEQRQVESL